MYRINLTIEEHQALVDVLECSISEIRDEIVHTDRRDLKELLKNRKKVLIQMLEHAKEIQTAAGAC